MAARRAAALTRSAKWERRYAREDLVGFEWYVDYAALRPFVRRLAPGPDAEVLVVGCGTSRVPGRLVKDGFRHVTCVDFAAPAVERMKAIHASDPIEWVVMDARKMDIPSGCCDLVLDKALLDCMCCSEDAVDQISALLSEVHRVLRPGGVYLVVSHGKPGTRLPHFEAAEVAWRVLDTVKLPKTFGAGLPHEPSEPRCHYLYVFAKAP